MIESDNNHYAYQIGDLVTFNGFSNRARIVYGLIDGFSKTEGCYKVLWSDGIISYSISPLSLKERWGVKSDR